jgi:undecaprenyl pyrophosphate synthase
MTGKIFQGSSNVYEDQGKVLFEHLRQVAESIVGEEERLEKEIAVANEATVQLEAQRKGLILKERLSYGASALVAVLFFLVGIVPGLVLGAIPVGYALYCMKGRKETEVRLAEEQQKAEQFQTAHNLIRRDYQVRKLGVAYVPVAGRIGFEGKQFQIDYTNSAPKKEFKLNTVRQGELFASSVNELSSLLNEVPLVERSSEVEEVATDQYSSSIQTLPMYDYLGKLDRSLRTTAFCLEDLETNSVSLPVIFPKEAYAKFLSEFGTPDTGSFATISAFDTERFSGELEAFQRLNQMKNALERQSGQFEQVLRDLMVNVAGTVQALTALKVASTSKLVEGSNRLLFGILKAPYNHYSPRLEAEEIERIRTESFDYQASVDSYVPFQLKASSRVLFDPVSEVWLAEDGSKTSSPFGMSQIHEEIVAPMVLALMKENRLERLKIYNAIKDQKISYLNKWHQDTEDFYGRNRAESADLINLMRSSFTEFVASYNTFQSLEQTEAQMARSGLLADTKVEAVQDAATLVAAYEAKRKDYQAVQEGFNAYMERMKEDIDRRSAGFGFIEYYDASIRDGAARTMAQAESHRQDLDVRRRPLLAVNPHYAEASELPPAPSVSELNATHSALNLPAIAKNALAELDAGEVR